MGSTAACDGGDATAAVGHIIASGGALSTEDYEYEGQAGFCRSGRTRRRAARFRAFSRVPPHDDRALMEALYSRGPLAVSFDASHASIAFYSGGVYVESACMWRRHDLDHSVLLVGYGTDDTLGDYWLIRNSWSDLWGDDGYIKVSRDNYGCGIATDAMYVIADVGRGDA